ncbi:methyl-accepting chemotaxis protein [Lachnospiraceae bacterium KM106-2]|nr:methyl-accepting chemotaxis protein [Lachnospiraceae bacterium KM106-2]
METKKGKVRSIKVKLLMGILPAIIVTLLAIILVVSNMTHSSLMKKTNSLVKAETESAVNEISGWLQTSTSAMDTIATTINKNGMNEKEMRTYLKNILNTNDSFPDGAYIAVEDGTLIDGTGWDPGDGLTDTDWYKQGQSSDTFVFGTPYVDDLTKEYVVTAVKKLQIYEGKTSTFAADIKLKSMTELIKKITVAGSGDAFIIDATDGSILGAKDKKIVGKTAKKIKDTYYKNVYDSIKAKNTKQRSFTAQNGKSYFTDIELIPGTSWYVVGRVQESVIFKDVTSLQTFLWIFGVIAIILIAVVIERLVHRMIKPIKSMTNSIVAVSSGDFTEDIVIKGNDEIAIMGHSLKDYVLKMREVISALAGIANELNTKAGHTGELSKELHESAGIQSTSMAELSKTVEELVNAINEIAENATSLAQIVADTSADGESVVADMKVTKEAVQQGRSDMGNVNQAMNRIQNSMGVLEQSIGEVGEKAVKIDEITNVISNIADETNLLALNANIEAARAGEAGKGFAVVANQIKSLADTSADAAAEISELISAVSTSINSTVTQSQNNMEEIKDSVGFVDKASTTFDEIYHSINKTNDTINHMIAKVKEVDEVAVSVAAITEEQSASAEEIEATSEQITNLAQTVTDNSEAVENNAHEFMNDSDRLAKQIAIFKVK